MKSYLPFCFLSLLSLPHSVLSQAAGNYEYNQFNTKQYMPTAAHRNPATNAQTINDQFVQLEVNGLMNAVADSYVAVFNVVQVAETMDSVDLLMNRRITNFINKLKAVQIGPENVKIDLISFLPRYEIQVEQRLFSKSNNEVPSGFEMQKNIMVHYKNSAKLDDIVSAGASSEIYDIIKVDYFLASQQKALDTLRTVCLKEMKERVKSFETIRFRLDTLKKTMEDNFTVINPQNRYFTYQAFSRPNLYAAKKKGSSQTEFREFPKPVSKFYNQVDYDQYDLVIHPVITEPVVQISYSITVRYYLRYEENPRNVYYILTPTGELKAFNPK